MTYPNQPQAVAPQAPDHGFSAPKAGASDRLAPEQCAGHLLMIVPVKLHVAFFAGRPIKDSNPPAMSAPSDAIQVNVVDFDTPGSPTVYKGVMWGQKVIAEGLADQIGETILARFYKGVAKGGNSAPWLLEDATGKPEDVARAIGWRNANPTWQAGPSTAELQAAAQAAQFAPQAPWPAGAQPPPAAPPMDPAYAQFLAAQQAAQQQAAQLAAQAAQQYVPPAPAAPPVDPAYAAWLASQQQATPAAPQLPPAAVPGQVNLNDPAVQALLAQMAAQQQS